MMSEILLETRGLSKEFKGFTAVSAVDLQIHRGTIHALIGPNGAGKTTVFNLLTKFLLPSGGQILYKGRDITAAKPADIARQGIVRSFQISAVFPHLTAHENLLIALQRKEGLTFRFWRSRRSLDRFHDRARELLASVGLEHQAETVAVELPYGSKRSLEIVTTLALDPELLLLDEPTQGMGREDVDRVVDLIRAVSANRTVLMVEHNLSVVSRLSDHITVLQRGSVVAEGNYETVSNNPEVRAAYIGGKHESTKA
ncbi:ABC transporter ATP-binding protein [Marinobacter caseinilyticus]|uniref:ABC transporter ATP-binding protein n=1 Tax=Marinobacter caseinilyticus TaxID=2692195 RepID=UPI001F18AF85|nr:ABC transporter ATP-binding protein [Marinobacter caseinilyticus]